MTAPAPPSLIDPPRERLRRDGPSALTTVELIAILLGTGRPGQNVVQLATSLHDAAQGSLRQLARAPAGALVRQRGVGLAKAARLAAALELGRRLAREVQPARSRIRTPEDIVGLLGDRLRDLEVEEFHTVVLSTQHDVLKVALVSRGILNGSVVHPREVFRAAIAEAGAAVVLVHNHPSGDPTPSPEDRTITAQMIEAGRVLGIPVLDHVILAGDRWLSLASEGLFG
jgi:DNA repair protein RadC